MEEPIENVTFECMKRVVLSVTNDLVTDQRVHRVAVTLMKQGCHVTLVGRLLPNSLPIQRPYVTHRMRLLFKRTCLFYAEYNVRLFFYLLFTKVDILVANDLDTLAANYLVSIIRRKDLVYDSHEYFTEVPELENRRITRNIWEAFECIILPKIRYSYTVCESIANLYNKKYGINMKVIRNLPIRTNKSNVLIPYPGLPQMDFVLYQGSVNKGRGLEVLVDAFEYIDAAKCVIVGDGDIMPELKDRIIKRNLKEKVILFGKVPFEDLNRITPLAKLGVSIEENIGLSYSYALPNKVFDYIQAEIPVLCSNLVEVAQVVTQWNIGSVIDNHDPKHIAQKINGILSNEAQVNTWKQNLAKAAKELCWENEEATLLQIYHPLVN